MITPKLAASVGGGIAVWLFTLAALAQPGGVAPPHPPAPPHPVAPRPRAPRPPAPEVRLRIEAPSPRGTWQMRIVNEGAEVVRIPADARLLRLEIDPPQKGKRPVRCVIPPPLRPEGFPQDRALYLSPGHAYVEPFDPALICFGSTEAAALRAGARVRPFFGWSPSGRGTAPFAVEGVHLPARLEPQKQLVGAPIVLREGGSPAPVASDEGGGSLPGLEGIDQEAPRLAITAAPFAEAIRAASATVTLTAQNLGGRAAHVFLLPRMVGFRISGPDGVKICDASLGSHDVAPELFSALPTRGTRRIAVRLQESCPAQWPRRPGLYRITPTLFAFERDEDAVGSTYAEGATAPRPTLLRVLSGPLPYHASPPRAVPLEGSSVAAVRSP